MSNFIIKYLAVSAIAVGTIMSAATSASFAQTKLNISLGGPNGTEPAPQCAFPCQEKFELPGFARTLALAGPEGSFETPLSRLSG